MLSLNVKSKESINFKYCLHEA